MSDSSPFRIDIQSPNARALQDAYQHQLALHGYSASDDPVMAEYIVVMLANQKTKDQITAELTDLVGPEYQPAFTEWLWDQAHRYINRTDLPPPQSDAPPTDAQPQHAIEHEADASTSSAPQQRRSASPMRQDRADDRRRSISPESRNRRTKGDSWTRDDGSQQRASRGWSDQDDAARSNGHGRAFMQQMPRHRPPRELFNSALAQATGPRGAPRQPRNQGGDGWGQRQLAMDDPSLSAGQQAPQWQTGPMRFGMRIQGVSQSQSNDVAPSTVSIFGRAGVPDPRAAEFVPGRAAAEQGMPPAPTNGASIFSRIDPMIPNNAPPPTGSEAAAAAAAAAPPADYPVQPTETALCRWNLGCTNPMCPYSHASPANAGKGGDPNALVLSQEACRFGAGCTNRDCTRSHVSPAVAFIDRKTASAVATLSAQSSGPSTGAAGHPAAADSRQPCRFQLGCTNASCQYAHFDEGGNVVPSPALRALTSRPPVPTSASVADATMSSEDSVDLQMDGGAGTTADEGGRSAATSGMDRALGDGDRGAKRCKFGVACTRPDCFFSHPPGRRLGGGGGAAAKATSTSQTPCRFGLGCTRSDCYFSHPPGRTVPPPTSSGVGGSHISDRLARFAQPNDGEMETIIPSST